MIAVPRVPRLCQPCAQNVASLTADTAAALRALAFAALLLLSFSARLHAELPAVRLDGIRPLGAAAGTTFDLSYSGRDTEDVARLWFDHPGFAAEWVEQGKFRVTVSSDVPEGTYDVRLMGRYGVSNPRILAVSRTLADVAEVEPNDAAAAAQALPLNVAVHGLSDGNNQDVYRIELAAGHRVTIVCQAQELDSEMDATLLLADESGKILAGSSDYYGRDPLLDFAAAEAGVYLITVHDLVYRGGYPYRLVVTTAPHVENVFPLAAEPGKPLRLTALGRNLPGAASSEPGVDPPLQSLAFDWTPPEAPAAGFTFLEHPVDHSVLPTAATATLCGWQVRLPGALRAQPILAAAGPVSLDAEPNDNAAAAQTLDLPATLAGRFDSPRDADWFSFTPAPDASGAYAVEVYSERIGGRADPYVVLTDDAGTRIAEYDDFGHRLNAFDGHLRDPVGSLNLEAGKSYRLLVQDRYGRGGPRFQYVMCLRRQSPDFSVAAMHSENPGPAAPLVRAGGAAWIDLVTHHLDGFGNAIEVTVEGLPPGLHAATTSVTDSRGHLVLWADADAAEWTGPLRLVARGEQDGRSLTHDVRPYTRVWPAANIGSSRPMRELVVAVRPAAPFGLEIEPAAVTAQAGQAVEVQLRLTRHWPQFTGGLRVTPHSFTNGFAMAEGEIAAGQNSLPLTIQIPAGIRPGNYTVTVLGQAQVPFDKDPQAANPANTLVTTPARPLTITVVPAAQ